MNAIFKKENVFIVIKDKDLRDGINGNEIDSLIYDYDYKDDVCLFGGRVHLRYGSKNEFVKLKVDGISIQEVYYKDSVFSVGKEIDLCKTAAFLNQMENLGVDSFLENYKKQLLEFKKELEIEVEKTEQEQSVQFDEDRSTFLTSLKKFINELTCIIFCLLINMNAGLDNQFYTDAYNEIINLYF